MELEEKKTYGMGRVEITAEEYRDLITELAETKKELQAARLRNYDLTVEIKNTKQELDGANERLDSWFQFIDGDESVKEAFIDNFGGKFYESIRQNS